jgi:hypothetical protein
MPAGSSAAFGGFGASQPAFGAAAAFGAPAAASAVGGFGAPVPAFGGSQVPNTSVAMFQPSKGPDGSTTVTAGNISAAQATYVVISHMQPYQVDGPWIHCGYFI